MSAEPAPAAQPLALVADAVSVRRGERTILADVSFRVEAGRALTLTGANGTGKTTLLRTISGFLRPASGRLALSGGDSAPATTGTDIDIDIGTDIAQRCHFVGHLDAIKGTLSVADNLAFWAGFLGGTTEGARARVDGAMKRLGLESLADIPASYLSAGQKRRLGLARLFVADRPLWLLDEPTVSLDASSVDLPRTAITTHLAGGGIVLAATHVDLGLPGARILRLGATSASKPGHPGANADHGALP